MQLLKLKPRKAINPAFLKVKPTRDEIEVFKANLIQLIDRTNETSSEEFHKNLIIDFFKKTYYGDRFFINTKGKTDLVIHNGNKASNSVGVLLETKKPTNQSEMITTEKLNRKALQELVLYYLRERITHKNLEVKHLIITNAFEWFMFDATLFDRLFAQNKDLVKKFQNFELKNLSDSTTHIFYTEIAAPFIAEHIDELSFTHFDVRDYQKVLRNADKADDRKLIALFKLLSPEHLLKLPFANDSNSLDKRFYAELLHIMGLAETKVKGKKIIDRNPKNERQTGALLENTIIQLDSRDRLSQFPNNGAQFGKTADERLFSVGLELCITWINRILFLKLLEAQLVAYHRGDKAYAFLNSEKIKNYDDLDALFFQVLARKYDERNADVRQVFERVPYLNSSLFEPTEIEQNTLFISNLRDDKTIPILSSTVLKNSNGKKQTGELTTLQYLFSFLNAYDFSSEGSEDIQEDNKTLINASVLGLIFEKINGYKDGSFFTPGFITMYMCRETIRRAVVQKFNETKNWTCENITDLHNNIENKSEAINEANVLINSIKVCDPAVGSGHFLVSALNEIIAIKKELEVLQDRNGRRLKGYDVNVVNDELIIRDDDGKLFEYNPKSLESQRVQETLFHEKQTIIENCLFGVDINPNSVKICRLRLWIELLKNAYYKNETELETLPNIDINIKCGNSLVSRFALDADLKQTLRKSKYTIDSYRVAVDTYRNAENKEQKREMERLISDIKSDFRTEISRNEKSVKKLERLQAEYNLLVAPNIFGASNVGVSKANLKTAKKRISTLENDIEVVGKTIDEIKSNKIYENAFEWRFEFPEVLNDDGDFIGFDVVIGNPPYFSLSKLKEQSSYFVNAGYETYSKGADIYCLFYEKGIQLLRSKGLLTFITSNSWLKTQYGELLRTFLVKNTNPKTLINVEDFQIFEDATVESNIIEIQKSDWQKSLRAVAVKSDFNATYPLEKYIEENGHVMAELPSSGWTIGGEKEAALKMKIEQQNKTLGQLDYQIFRGFTTGFNAAFFITTEKRNELILEDKNCEQLIKPALRGKDISKYAYRWNDVWIILLKQGMTNAMNITKEDPETYFKNAFPSIYNHLKTTGDASTGKGKGLYLRDDQGDYWWELRPCVYYDDFEKEKIVWGELSDSQKFTFDDSGMFANNTIFFINGDKLKSLLSVLNSSVASWYFNEISTSSGMGTNRWLKYKIELLPIKEPNPNQEIEIEQRVNQILALKKADPEADTSALEAEIDALVYELYGLTADEIKIVEGA